MLNLRRRYAVVFTLGVAHGLELKAILMSEQLLGEPLQRLDVALDVGEHIVRDICLKSVVLGHR